MDHRQQLGALQESYRHAVQEWLAAIREEEALATVDPSVAQIDRWEGAHFIEEIARNKTRMAKQNYEDAVRTFTSAK